MDSIGDESIGVREHRFKEYGAEGLIASSVDFGWSGLSAELRAHGRGVITKSTKAETEVCVAICPSNSLVTRLTAGVVDRTIAERGTIWLSPPGPKEVLLNIAAPVPQVLHMYLPARYFSAERPEIGLRGRNDSFSRSRDISLSRPHSRRQRRLC